MTRDRKVTWHEGGAAPWTTVAPDAITYLRAVRDGRLPKPPLYELLRIDVKEAEIGRVEIAILPDDSFISPAGRIGGGILVTALDTCLAWACDTRAPPRHACTTVEIKTNFLRAVSPPPSSLRVRAECIAWGSRILVATGQILDENDRLCATATATCLAISVDEYGRSPQPSRK
jgi:uncharacterized protein (TIGR00369 family)